MRENILLRCSPSFFIDFIINIGGILIFLANYKKEKGKTYETSSSSSISAVRALSQ